jgi:hypothetical protein
LTSSCFLSRVHRRPPFRVEGAAVAEPRVGSEPVTLPGVCASEATPRVRSAELDVILAGGEALVLETGHGSPPWTT